MAYASTPPKMAAIPFPENQMQLLIACSDGVYHMPISMVNPGLIALSNTPRRTLSEVKPAKFEAAA